MKITVTRNSLVVLLLVHLLIFPLYAQQPTPANINSAIRKEETDNSKIMRTLHYLTDLYGPRLTGSPNHVAAANWAVKEMRSWGFDKAELEPWEFGHPGWVNERSTVLMTSPVQDTLTFEVLAWTRGTKKAVKTTAFNLVLPERPNQEELTAYLESVKTQVKGKAVLVGNPAVIPVDFKPPAKRIDDETLRKRFDPTATPQPFPTPAPQPTPRPNQLTNRQIGEQLDSFLVMNGAGPAHQRRRTRTRSDPRILEQYL